MTSPDVIAIGRRATARQFMDDEFLLESRVASDLYHCFAEPQPIIDYHSHLPPEQIATDHRFRSLTEIWLDGDHYKWRAMRANGVAERLITGKAADWENSRPGHGPCPTRSATRSITGRIWSCGDPFGIDALLSAMTARDIFDRCNARLREDDFTRCGMLRSSASPSSAPPTIPPIR